jgi:nicotinate phosphoribosyltransferase
MRQLERMRPDHLRKLNPTPYKVRSITIKLDVTYLIPLHLNLTHAHVLCAPLDQVSVSAQLYDFIHFLWLNEAPVGELQ